MENKELYNSIRKQMLKSEEALNKYATKSEDAIRLKKEKKDIRLDFARDIDRIIHTSSYTRYIDKTQVYSNIKNDNVSRRMTHVQFVSRASKTIARALGLNEDLCEAISLGHDVGHVPFGHYGERLLNNISKRRTGKCFAHNINSVRVFKDVEKCGEGCNLTLQVLDGIMCHNGEFVQKEYAPIKKSKEDFLKEYDMCFEDESKIKKLIPMTLEGCVVRISDIIGYIGKDIDDAKKLNLFDTSMIPDKIKTILGTKNVEIMNNIITDVIINSFGKEYIQMSDEVYEQVCNLKAFNYEYIYNKAMSKNRKEKIEYMFNMLYEYYIDIIKKEERDNDIYTVFLNDMNEEYLNKSTIDEKVIDYISSMTDNFFERQFKKYIRN